MPPPAKTKAAVVEMFSKAGRTVPTCTAAVHGIMISVECVGHVLLMTCNGCAFFRCFSPFIWRAKRSEVIWASVTRPVTMRLMTSVISTPDKFSNFANFSIISHPSFTLQPSIKFRIEAKPSGVPITFYWYCKPQSAGLCWIYKWPGHQSNELSLQSLLGISSTKILW